MGTETYPKRDKASLMAPGSQETVSWDAEAKGRTTYPASDRDLRAHYDDAHVRSVDRPGGGKAKGDYPRKAPEKFATERGA